MRIGKEGSDGSLLGSRKPGSVFPVVARVDQGPQLMERVGRGPLERRLGKHGEHPAEPGRLVAGRIPVLFPGLERLLPPLEPRHCTAEIGVLHQAACDLLLQSQHLGAPDARVRVLPHPRTSS